MDVVTVSISKLRHAEYNPRKITPEDFEQIKNSIEQFGFVQPLVVNCAPGREGVVIGGNQRLEVAQKMGMTEVPVYYVEIPDINREKELNIRLNRNLGTWDFESLTINFDLKKLLDWGFQNWEIPSFSLEEIDQEKDEDVTGDRLKIYSNNPIRQIVLYFTEEQFEKIIKRMNALCQEHGVSNYSELIWFLTIGEKLESSNPTQETNQP